MRILKKYLVKSYFIEIVYNYPLSPTLVARPMNLFSEGLLAYPPICSCGQSLKVGSGGYVFESQPNPPTRPTMLLYPILLLT
jgi:hypothetical protein